ncbi:MAG: hypothetical protein A2Z34_04660 [Planctomycetes bacterium RBG_16_59_8]|nr:MAG: hypothetical protein A2Z34_04660 [Planctomycetes bacterium RBG_16_59_8]
MKKLLFIAALIMLAAAAAPPRDEERIRDLVEQLGDDDWNTRQRAACNLIGEGPAALPQLNEATQSPDAEVASKARIIIDIIGKTGGIRLSPALAERRPEIYQELIAADGEEKRRLLLRTIAGAARERPAYPEQDQDIDQMALYLLRKDEASLSAQEKLAMIAILQTGRSTDSLAILTGDRDPAVRKQALTAMAAGGALSNLPAERKTEVVRNLLSVLGELPENEKKSLTKELASSGEELEKVLVALAQTTETDIRRGAVIALCEIAPERHVAEIASRLRDWDAAIRARAVETLGRLKATEHAGKIAPLLKDPSPVIRLRALGALEAIGCQPYAVEIAPLVFDKDEPLRKAAQQALSQCRSLEVVRIVLIHMSRQNNGYDLSLVNNIAAWTKERRYLKELTGLLGDDNSYVRVWAANTLIELKPTEIAGDLVKLVGSDKPDIGAAAARVLIALRVPEVVPELLPILQHKEWMTRWHALRTLRACGNREQAAAVVPLLEDPVTDIRSEAVLTLANWNAAEHGDAIAARLRDTSRSIRDNAIYAISKLGLKAHAGKVAEFLKDSDSSTRCQAASPLATLGAKEYAGEIVPLLSDPVFDSVRAVGADTLGTLGAVEHTDAIAALLKDKSGNTRAKAAEVLARLGARQWRDDIVPLLQNKNSWERGWAAIALVELGGKDLVTDKAIDDIAALTRFADEKLFSRATNALKELGLTDPAEIKKRRARAVGHPH